MQGFGRSINLSCKAGRDFIDFLGGSDAAQTIQHVRVLLLPK